MAPIRTMISMNAVNDTVGQVYAGAGRLQQLKERMGRKWTGFDARGLVYQES